MKILHVISSLDPATGGPAEGLRQSCRSARRLGHCYEVLTLDAPLESWLTAFPAPVHAVGPTWLGFAYAKRLPTWLKRHAHNYDAVIVHGLWQFHGMAVWRALRRSATPYYVYPHGMLDPWFKRRYPLKHLKKWLYWSLVERHLLADAAAILFTTESEARLASASFPNLSGRIVIAGFGIARPEVEPERQVARFLDAFPQCRGKRLVLFLSRLHEKKGCEALIEGFARVARADPALCLVMAGAGSAAYRARLGDLAARHGLVDRVVWTGLILDDVKWGALQAAEVLALLSHQENFGVVIAEALSLGIPVLTSYPVNIWEAIEKAGAGFVGDDTADGAQDVLCRWLATSAQVKAAMQIQARECFTRFFHVDAATTRLIELIEATRAADAQGECRPAVLTMSP